MFRVGQRVRCIRGSADNIMLVTGHDYIVQRITEGAYLLLVGQDRVWMANRFVIVAQPVAPEPLNPQYPVTPPNPPPVAPPPPPAPPPVPQFKINAKPVEEFKYHEVIRSTGEEISGLTEVNVVGSAYPTHLWNWTQQNYTKNDLGNFFSCAVGALGSMSEHPRITAVPEALKDECIQRLNKSFRQSFTFCSMTAGTKGHPSEIKCPELYKYLLKNGWKELPPFFNKYHGTSATQHAGATASGSDAKMVFLYYVDPSRII